MYENEDDFVDEILKQIDYDLWKEVINNEVEYEEQSDERISIKITLNNYFHWRKNLG